MPTREEQDKACMAIGRAVLRMMRDLLVAGPGPAYARTPVRHPGGVMEIVLVNDFRLADTFETAMAKAFPTEQHTPYSEVN